ncbi:MAG: hypothetical protein D6729_13485 [Deltaproteobacteria bacterium]|nr:MAG: hypothetical protein D6729_13485 [Deltaproteobacteria bacterium]
MSPPAAVAGAFDAAAHVRQIRSAGYTVVPKLYGADEVAFLRRELTAVWEENGRFPFYQDTHGYVAEDIEIWGLGLVFHKLLRFRPELAPHLLKPQVAEILRGLFGDGAYIEKTGAVLSDSTRPFFQWHTHVGGIDDELYRRMGWTPHFEKAQRVVVLLYLDDLDADGGQVLIWPRRENDPNIEPPFPIANTRWEGQIEISCPAGSVVIIEQCTWHAALPRRIPGVRMFIGAYFASREAPPTFDVDETLLDLSEAGPLLQSFQPAEARSVQALGLDPSEVPDAYGLIPRGSSHADWTRLVAGVAERHGATLAQTILGRSRCTFRFETAEGSGVDVVVEPRRPGRPALCRSDSFNLVYRNVRGAPTDPLRDLVRDAVETIRRSDNGSLRFEPNEEEGGKGA